jgi:hypothetical protein
MFMSWIGFIVITLLAFYLVVYWEKKEKAETRKSRQALIKELDRLLEPDWDENSYQ